nr:unnamed protein product [Callosobruchus chinensis]
MRTAVPVTTKLEITLRYLATGNSFKSLEYLLRVPETTISRFLLPCTKTLLRIGKPTIASQIFAKYLSDQRNIRVRWCSNWRFFCSSEIFITIANGSSDLSTNGYATVQVCGEYSEREATSRAERRLFEALLSGVKFFSSYATVIGMIGRGLGIL